MHQARCPGVVPTMAPLISGSRVKTSFAIKSSRAWCQAMVASSGTRATAGLVVLERSFRRDCSSDLQRSDRSEAFKDLTEGKSGGEVLFLASREMCDEGKGCHPRAA